MFAVITWSKHVMFHQSWGVGLSGRMLKPDTGPTVFAFISPKHRKLNEARLIMAEHKAVVAELLDEKT